jgi:hypothetical protein
MCFVDSICEFTRFYQLGIQSEDSNIAYTFLFGIHYIDNR